MTDPKVLERWRAVIERAWNGDEQPFLFYFTEPATDTRTRELDADGKRIVEYTWNDVPGEVRQDIVNLLIAHPFIKRGREQKLDVWSVFMVREQFKALKAHKWTDTDARKLIAKNFDVSVATVRNVLEHKNAYADTPASKEKRRIATKDAT